MSQPRLVPVASSAPDAPAPAEPSFSGPTPATPPPAEPPPLFRPLGRRPRYSAEIPTEVPRLHKVVFEASRLRAARRLFTWWALIARTLLLLSWDRMRGRRGLDLVGVRVREAFERAGGTFVKIGQQLSSRVDLIPYAVCHELGRLFDRMPAFPVEHAIAAIERASGRPMAEVFEAFDPTPIGSASVSCVYQAVLRGGEKVAVKVRRPGIGERFADDLMALDWLLGGLELFTILRPGTTKMLRIDLRAMLLEELDFSMEARYAELYRRQARRDKIEFIDAPRVHHELSSQDVVIEEFVSGIFLSELLDAVEANDTAHLARLAAQGIKPHKVARRLLYANYWSFFEGLLFHADPHPANIVVRPGSKLVFIDFGACGQPSARMRRINFEMLSKMVRNDVSGVARVGVSVLEPMPHVDVDYMRKRIEALWWRFLYSMRSKHAKWWERTSAGIWLAVLEGTREMQIPVSLDMLRNMRATLLYDTLCARLYGKIDERVFLRYVRERQRRLARRVVARWTDERPDQRAARLVTRADELLQTGEELFSIVRRFTEHSPSYFMQAASKASYAVTNLLSFAARVAVPAVALGIARAAAIAWRTGQAPSLYDSIVAVALHPAYLAYATALAIIVMRRLAFRLGDSEPKQ